MFKPIYIASALATLFMLSSCHSTQVEQSEEALLHNESPETRAQLEASIGAFFNGQPIKLASDVFKVKSTVLIERTHNNKLGVNEQRGLPQADVFTLLVNKNGCALRHEPSQKIIALPTIGCKPAGH